MNTIPGARIVYAVETGPYAEPSRKTFPSLDRAKAYAVIVRTTGSIYCEVQPRYQAGVERRSLVERFNTTRNR